MIFFTWQIGLDEAIGIGAILSAVYMLGKLAGFRKWERKYRSK